MSDGIDEVIVKDHLMVENVVIEPMAEEFVLWRCLHPHHL